MNAKFSSMSPFYFSFFTKNKNSFISFLFLFYCVFFSNIVSAQTCNYTLQMNDTFGDGWNGSALTVIIGCDSTTYTLEDGDFEEVVFEAGTNDLITFDYAPGAFQNEVFYFVFDSQGDTIFMDGTNPAVGQVFQSWACDATCTGPTDFVVDNIFGLSADVSWTASTTSNNYFLEFGPSGFVQGTGTILNTSDLNASVTGLEENTTYDFYVRSICANGDTSGVTCPQTFRTIALNDLGITSINGPLTGCDLGGGETISVTMTNFGANPQSLVPFKYSVNGQEASITIPLDGYYTNVLGKDSSVVLDFMTTFDFSGNGEYLIAAWTELEGDSDISNDTTYFKISSIPLTNVFPSNQDFENGNGGWVLDENSTNPSWAFGQPAGEDILNASSGINAWVTNLEGNYNNNENSYIVSNCFDLSDFTTDPMVSFSINFDSELAYDGAWLDASMDGGNTWTKVGAIGDGINWYTFDNTNNDLGEVWAGNSGGWIFAKNELTGMAGESEVRFRFGFGSDGSVSNFDGVGIDNFSIFEEMTNDILGHTLTNSSEVECGEMEDQLTLNIVNNGSATQTGFDVAYQINNDPPVIENVGTLSIAPNESADYTFTTPFNSTNVGTYNIVAWTALQVEENFSNDTTNFLLNNYRTLPLSEDFETGSLSSGWASNGTVGTGHASPSFVVFRNMYSAFTNTLELSSPTFGPVSTSDSMFIEFDYRYVDFFAGTDATVLGEGDSLKVEVSVDCGTTYNTVFTIDQSNHIDSNAMQRIELALSIPTEESIKVRFMGIWGEGDYYLDIDNINIFQCTDFELLTSSVDAVGTNGENGVASVNPTGNAAPYTYLWENGATTSEVTGLSAGSYSVTVTNRFGCSSTTEVTVGTIINTNEIDELKRVNLYPNPTSDWVTLEMSFSKSVDVEIQVTNLVGQLLYTTNLKNATQEKVELDLEKFPAGMYFVRMKVDTQSSVLKLMKN